MNNIENKVNYGAHIWQPLCVRMDRKPISSHFLNFIGQYANESGILARLIDGNDSHAHPGGQRHILRKDVGGPEAGARIRNDPLHVALLFYVHIIVDVPNNFAA